MDNDFGGTQYNLSALCRYQQFGNSVSFEENLVAASVGDRKPRKKDGEEDAEGGGRNKYTRLDGLRDNRPDHMREQA
jgi:hypothetical protein